MAKYLVIEKSWLQLGGHLSPRIVEAGEKVDFDGPPSRNMAPLDPEARGRKAAWLASRPALVRKLDERAEKLALARMGRGDKAMIAAASVQIEKGEAA